ncbi:hypothetical protein A200_00265 [Parascardovia denticolens IPLA 20019]|nr:hypothetical protein A200_00265 [Parascardovia denticolens IPLA 20019]
MHYLPINDTLFKKNSDKQSPFLSIELVVFTKKNILCNVVINKRTVGFNHIISEIVWVRSRFMVNPKAWFKSLHHQQPPNFCTDDCIAIV